MENKNTFKLKPMGLYENKTSKNVSPIKYCPTESVYFNSLHPSFDHKNSQNKERKESLSDFIINKEAETDTQSEESQELKREISIWKDFKTSLMTGTERKYFEDDDAEQTISSNTVSNSSLGSYGDMSTKSLRWKKNQYDEIKSSACGTPPWSETQQTKRKIKMPKWTTEYFLQKTNRQNGRTEKEENPTQRPTELQGSIIDTEYKLHWFLEPSTEIINPKISHAPAPTADENHLLQKHQMSKEIIERCSLLAADQVLDDTWNLYGPYEEELPQEVKVRKNIKEVKLWPHEEVNIDDHEKVRKYKNWGGDKGSGDGEMEIRNEEQEQSTKRNLLSHKEYIMSPEEKTREASELAVNRIQEHYFPDSAQEKLNQLYETKQTSIANEKITGIKMHENDLTDISKSGFLNRVDKKSDIMDKIKTAVCAEKEGIKQVHWKEIITKVISLENEASHLTESDYFRYSSPTTFSKSNTSKNDRTQSPKNKVGLDFMFSSSGSECSSTGSYGSELNLQMVSSDSELHSSDSKEATHKKAVMTSEQGYPCSTTKKISDEKDAVKDVGVELLSEMPPQLDDFTPIYKQTLRRLRAVSEGVDPDAYNSGKRALQKDPSQSLAEPIRPKAETVKPTEEDLTRRNLEESVELWMGQWRHAYFDLFQGEVNVILRSNDGHFLVVDLQILKNMDVFKLEIDAVGDANFVKKVHFLPQVSMLNAIRVLLWCAYMINGSTNGEDVEELSEISDDDLCDEEKEDEEDEEEEEEGWTKFELLSKDDEPEEDPSADSDDSWLNFLLDDSNKSSKSSKRRKTRGKKSIWKDSQRKNGKEGKEKKRKGGKLDSGSGPREKRYSNKFSKNKSPKEKIGDAQKLSLMKEPQALEDLPGARLLLRELAEGLSAGEVARLVADADALGVAPLVRGLLGDLAARTVGCSLPSIQALLDPSAQAVGLGQLLCYTKVTLDKERRAFLSYKKLSPSSRLLSPKSMSPQNQQERASVSKINKGRSKKKSVAR